MMVDPPANDSWPSAMLAAGVAVVVLALMRGVYRRLGRRGGRSSSSHLERQPRPTGPWDGAMRDAEALSDRAQVELETLARDLRGQLDSKIGLLRELVAQSERQAERLERLLAEAQRLAPREPGPRS